MTNHYTDVCETTIGSLRQQLAMCEEALRVEQEANEEALGRYQSLMRVSQERIDNREKQIVMLRDALTIAATGVACGVIQCAATKALAATQDLKNCILCDAEPCGYIWDIGTHQVFRFAQDDIDGTMGSPLYKGVVNGNIYGR